MASTCSIEGCGRKAKARGWCNMHYQRWRKHGDPEYVTPPNTAGTCSIEGCDRPAHARGWCSKHYMRWKAHGDPEYVYVVPPHTPKPCSIEGCDRPAHARGWCELHYARWRRYGDPEHVITRQPWCAVEGCDRETRVRGWCAMHYARWRKHGDPLADIPPKKKWGPDWRDTNSYGYVLIWDENRQQVVFEHRYVMEQLLGRELRADENVHHLNGVRDDNRPENLELWSTLQPKGQRVADKVEWAQYILDTYRDAPPEAVARKPKPRKRKPPT